MVADLHRRRFIQNAAGLLVPTVARTILPASAALILPKKTKATTIHHGPAAHPGGVLERHVTFSGTGRNRIYSSNAASVIQRFTVVADFITVTKGRPAETMVLVGQYGLSAPTQSWRLEIKVDGYSRLTIYDGKEHLINGHTFSPRWPGGSSSEPHVKWEYDYDGGGTGDFTFKDYYWNRVTDAWALIGSRTRIGKSFDPQNVATSKVPIHIGSNNFGANKFLGTIKRLRCYDGIGEGGTLLWDANANDYSDSGPTWVSTTSGETWNIDGPTVDVD